MRRQCPLARLAPPGHFSAVAEQQQWHGRAGGQQCPHVVRSCPWPPAAIADDQRPVGSRAGRDSRRCCRRSSHSWPSRLRPRRRQSRPPGPPLSWCGANLPVLHNTSGPSFRHGGYVPRNPTVPTASNHLPAPPPPRRAFSRRAGMRGTPSAPTAGRSEAAGKSTRPSSRPCSIPAWWPPATRCCRRFAPAGRAGTQ